MSRPPPPPRIAPILGQDKTTISMSYNERRPIRKHALLYIDVFQAALRSFHDSTPGDNENKTTETYPEEIKNHP